MSRILIVEDEPDIASVLADDLGVEGYEVTIAEEGEAALHLAREQTWDLILLDLMLPRKDGFEVCRELRRARIKTPIIMLTAKTQEAEKILGLELGADDYVTKPFSPRELRARIKAVLRRFQDDEKPSVYGFPDFQVDFDRGELRRGKHSLEATPLEFKLLSAFIRRRGRVLSRQQLIEEAWGRDTFVTDRVVDAHIVNLRRKIEPQPNAPRYLISVRGIGYRFDG
jgi:two-component system alkaline phosphatase synthesis response regulator PhoP